MDPRYIVWVSPTQFYCYATLADAMDAEAVFGGTIYSLLAMTAAELVAAEDDPDDLLDLDAARKMRE